jgi:serine/threonine-protein kinase
MDESLRGTRVAEVAAGHGLELVNRIGAGGMGEVYLARRRGAAGFERQLVVKRLAPTLTNDPQFAQALVKEANIMVRLSHPNVVQAQDLIYDGDEYLLVLEYVDGPSLRRIISAVSRARERLPVDFVLACVRHMARALEYAHDVEDDSGQRRPVVHCDVTPENVLVSKHGEVKLTDFGIARVLHTTALTGEGQIRGKFRYVAPEQVEGKRIAPPADVYSTGLVLYELLTLASARRGQNTVALISEALRREPVSLPEVVTGIDGELRDELDELVQQATSPDADARPSATEMATSIERLAAKREMELTGTRVVARYVRDVSSRLRIESRDPVQETNSPPTQPSRPLSQSQPGASYSRPGSASYSNTGSRTRPASKPKVLVVDDSDIVREVVRRAITRFGFDVETIGSGGEALDWLAVNHCDAVLVDLNMPDLSGLELTSFVRSNPEIAHLPIILLTSETESQRAVTGLGLGADDFVRKGVSEAEIAARIHAVLRRSRVPGGG